MRNNLLSYIIPFFIAFFVNINYSKSAEPHIIPLPVSLQTNNSDFIIKSSTKITYQHNGKQYKDILNTFATDIASIAEVELSVVNKQGSKGNISFDINAALYETLGQEGYLLNITEKGIEVEAVTEKGWFYATRTLLQLLTRAEVKNKQTWIFPGLAIEDYPRFEWRGLMVDVSRHFFSTDVLKSYINQMAKYKLNTLHLHLTDNQGWRIEIESMPKLTEIGAWRVPRTGYWKGFKAPQPNEKTTYGGYYSHDDIRDLVAYAAQRGVTIVPEIDVPGHSLAMIASYPDLSCTKTPQLVLAGDPWNPSRTNVLCVSHEEVYESLDKIIGEIAELFPSEYIHIGGDEVTRNYWKKCESCQKLMKEKGFEDEQELQSLFLDRVIRIVESKGKKAMGWYETLKGERTESMAQMSWKSYEGGIKSSQKGEKVVMTPAFFTYLDFYQGDPAMENGDFTVCRLSSSYEFDPIQEGVKEENILGGQGSLFTEQVPNERKLQYMTWPRGMALAEVLWSTKESRNWDSFIKRMETHFAFFDRDKIKYADVFYEPILKLSRNEDGMLLHIDTEVSGLRVYYSFDDCSPDEFYPEYVGQPVLVPEGAHHIRARSYNGGKPIGREMNIPIEVLEKRIK